jgi:hypothetical protein
MTNVDDLPKTIKRARARKRKDTGEVVVKVDPSVPDPSDGRDAFGLKPLSQVIDESALLTAWASGRDLRDDAARGIRPTSPDLSLPRTSPVAAHIEDERDIYPGEAARMESLLNRRHGVGAIPKRMYWSCLGHQTQAPTVLRVIYKRLPEGLPLNRDVNRILEPVPTDLFGTVTYEPRHAEVWGDYTEIDWHLTEKPEYRPLNRLSPDACATEAAVAISAALDPAQGLRDAFDPDDMATLKAAMRDIAQVFIRDEKFFGTTVDGDFRENDASRPVERVLNAVGYGIYRQLGFTRSSLSDVAAKLNAPGLDPTTGEISEPLTRMDGMGEVDDRNARALRLEISKLERTAELLEHVLKSVCEVYRAELLQDLTFKPRPSPVRQRSRMMETAIEAELQGYAEQRRLAELARVREEALRNAARRQYRAVLVAGGRQGAHCSKDSVFGTLDALREAQGDFCVHVSDYQGSVQQWAKHWALTHKLPFYEAESRWADDRAGKLKMASERNLKLIGEALVAQQVCRKRALVLYFGWDAGGKDLRDQAWNAGIAWHDMVEGRTHKPPRTAQQRPKSTPDDHGAPF